MQRNKVHHVHTVGRVAKDLGVDEDLIHELTLGLEPEDGVIWVYGVDDGDGTLAFTDEGVEEIQHILMEYSHQDIKALTTALRCSPDGYCQHE